jgi:hypothetical protein
VQYKANAVIVSGMIRSAIAKRQVTWFARFM